MQLTGDGILANFDGAARAVRCAIALRDAAVEQGLEMRTGVHTGEVDVHEDVISGVAIHEAARIMGLASAGQVLVSETTAALIRDAGIHLEDLGERKLRGFDAPRRLYSVVT
jgi:class 3 adenylate cyclase